MSGSVSLHEAMRTGVCLIEIHHGPATGQVFLMCGPCNGTRRVDNAPNGSIMELAAHILKHKDEARS